MKVFSKSLVSTIGTLEIQGLETAGIQSFSQLFFQKMHEFPLFLRGVPKMISQRKNDIPGAPGQIFKDSWGP